MHSLIQISNFNHHPVTKVIQHWCFLGALGSIGCNILLLFSVNQPVCIVRSFSQPHNIIAKEFTRKLSAGINPERTGSSPCFSSGGQFLPVTELPFIYTAVTSKVFNFLSPLEVKQSTINQQENGGWLKCPCRTHRSQWCIVKLYLLRSRWIRWQHTGCIVWIHMSRPGAFLKTVEQVGNMQHLKQTWLFLYKY